MLFRPYPFLCLLFVCCLVSSCSTRRPTVCATASTDCVTTTKLDIDIEGETQERSRRSLDEKDVSAAGSRELIIVYDTLFDGTVRPVRYFESFDFSYLDRLLSEGRVRSETSDVVVHEKTKEKTEHQDFTETKQESKFLNIGNRIFLLLLFLCLFSFLLHRD